METYYLRQVIKKGYLPISLLICLLISLGACTSQMIVKPLDRGEHQISANLGGPLIGFAGTTIPIPLTSINYAHGITDSLTLHGGLQLTSLAYQNIHFNVGATYGLLKPNGWVPGLSASGSFNLLSDMRQGKAKLYPQLDANLYWDYGQDHFMYLGSTNWIEFSKTKAHNEPQENRIITGIQFGNTFVKNNWSYTLESKWLAPTIDSRFSVVDYKSYAINGEPKGTVGIYIGIARKF